MRLKMVCTSLVESSDNGYHDVELNMVSESVSAEDEQMLMDAPVGQLRFRCRSDLAVKEYRKGESYFVETQRSGVLLR
jgi:hypothetical protein